MKKETKKVICEHNYLPYEWANNRDTALVQGGHYIKYICTKCKEKLIVD